MPTEIADRFTFTLAGRVQRCADLEAELAALEGKIEGAKTTLSTLKKRHEAKLEELRAAIRGENEAPLPFEDPA